MRGQTLAAAVACAAIASTALIGTAARANTGSPTVVGMFGCIDRNGGHVTRPAGSTIIVGQIIAEQTRGILQDFLNSQTTAVAVNGAPVLDVSSDWSAPQQVDDGFSMLVWQTVLREDTGVTLANPGDQMHFSASIVLSSSVPEVFNPAIGGEPGQPSFNGPGTILNGTCTVTAT